MNKYFQRPMNAKNASRAKSISEIFNGMHFIWFHIKATETVNKVIYFNSPK